MRTPPPMKSNGLNTHVLKFIGCLTENCLCGYCLLVAQRGSVQADVSILSLAGELGQREVQCSFHCRMYFIFVNQIFLSSMCTMTRTYKVPQPQLQVNTYFLKYIGIALLAITDTADVCTLFTTIFQCLSINRQTFDCFVYQWIWLLICNAKNTFLIVRAR